MADDPKKPKRKYTHSPRSLAQRRVAARRHGKRASTPMRQVLPACNRRQCPLADAQGNGYPCVMKETVEEKGGAIESCPLPFVANPQVRASVLQAIRTGDLSGLDEMAAASIAAQMGLAADELSKVMKEGLSIEDPLFDNEGNAIGQVTRKNPRAELTFKLLEMLGHTMEQQAATPKSRGERERDAGIGGYLGALAELRKKHAIGGATE